MTLREIERAEPVYETYPGWQRGSARLPALRRPARGGAQPTSSASRALVGVPVELISIGPDRDETIARMEPFRAA